MSDSEFVDLRTTIEDSNSNDSENDEITTVDLSKRGKFKSLEKSSKKRKIGEELEDDDDKELNKFLFGDKNKFLKNLEEKKTFFLDFRGDCNETSESSSSKWHDSDDDNYIRSKGLEAKDKQKRKHERIVGSKPIWANLGRKNVDVDEELITHSVGFLNESSSRSTSFLPRDIINFKRLGNLNRTTQKEGRIVSCEFHSKSTVGVTAGSKGLVSLFAIDGNENKKIHNVYYEKFIIHSCKLINNGTELLIGGQLRDFHTYNLMTGHKQRNKLPKGINHLKKFQISPCEKYIAVVGDFGEIHLLHSITKELLCSFKQEHQSTSLNFSTDSNEIFSHSDDNEVTIFDIRSQRVKHRFVDDGCVNGTSLALSPNGKFLATGGRQGFVNIYNIEDCYISKCPQPIKAISNLTTEITHLKFNHSTEILGMCSIDKKNALRLIHVGTASVFSNFPSHLDNIGKSICFDFSPESGFLSVGTSTSEVPLYRLQHFNNY